MSKLRPKNRLLSDEEKGAEIRAEIWDMGVEIAKEISDFDAKWNQFKSNVSKAFGAAHNRTYDR